MKFILLAILALPSLAFAADPQIDDISKSDLEKIANEISVNFSHTAVAAPETEGLWGIEVGLIGGVTGTPKLKDVVEDSGGDGKDFKSVPHGGLLIRAHFPLEFFAEVSVLPTVKAAGFETGSKSFAAGWNAGSHFAWPLDVAIAGQFTTSDLQFEQVLNNASTGNTDVNSKVKFDNKSSIWWLGVSKNFAFVTPYAKLGMYNSDSDVEVKGTGDIFAFSSNQKESVSTSGAYTALGVNLQLLLMRFGFEVSRTAGVGKVSGKFSLTF